MSKDFQVTIKVRNARFLRRMREIGYTSGAALSKACGVRQQHISGLLTMRLSPLDNGDWSDSAFAISSALHCEPEDIWPAHIARIKTNAAAISFDANIDELAQIPAPSEREMEPQDLKWLMSKLPPRKAKAISSLYGLDGDGGATFQEVGKELGVSSERTRQIIASGLRKLKHINYSAPIR